MTLERSSWHVKRTRLIREAVFHYKIADEQIERVECGTGSKRRGSIGYHWHSDENLRGNGRGSANYPPIILRFLAELDFPC